MNKHNDDEPKNPAAREDIRERVEETAEESKDKKQTDKERDFIISRRDAKGGSPADVSVGGEEDAGVGLEQIVRKDEQ